MRTTRTTTTQRRHKPPALGYGGDLGRSHARTRGHANTRTRAEEPSARWTTAAVAAGTPRQHGHAVSDATAWGRRRPGRGGGGPGRRPGSSVDHADTVGALRRRSAGARGRGYGHRPIPVGPGGDCATAASCGRP